MSSGYITDVPYPSKFYDFLSPGLLSYVAALNGFAPLVEPSRCRYLELGCGGGVALATLAAANPDAELVGVDLNPAHIAAARDLGAAGELANLRWVEADFRALDAAALGSFDIIALHGVWTWVPEEIRAALVAFLERALRPGGLLLITYNALPGSLVLQPLRDEMLARTRGAEGDSLRRMEQGLHDLRALAAAGAQYFERNPGLAEALESIAREDLRSLAHEFLNPCWSPMYFADVARALAPIGLVFAGGLPVASNYLELAIPESQQALFRGASSRFAAEAGKALLLNERFRRDVFVRATAPARPEPERLPFFEPQLFGVRSEAPQQEAELRVGMRRVTLELRGPIYERLLAELGRGARTLGELLSLPGLASEPPQAVLDSLHMLVAASQCWPFARRGPALAAGSRSPVSGLRIPVPLNRILLERAASAASAAYPASPAAGDGVGLSSVDALLLLAASTVGRAGAVAWAEARLAGHGQTLQAGERDLEVPDEQRQALADRLQELCTRTLPKLVELGIVELA